MDICLHFYDVTNQIVVLLYDVIFPVCRRRHQTTGEARAAPPTSLTLARRSFVTTTRISQGQPRFRVHRGIQLSHRQRELKRRRAQMNWSHLLVHQDLRPQVRILILLHYFLRDDVVFMPPFFCDCNKVELQKGSLFLVHVHSMQ